MGRAAYPAHKTTIALLRKNVADDAYMYDGELEATITERAERKFFRGDARALKIRRICRTEISVEAALLEEARNNDAICAVRLRCDGKTSQGRAETACFQAARRTKPAIWMLHFDGVPPKSVCLFDNPFELTAENAKQRRALSDEEAAKWMASRPTDAFLSDARLCRASFPLFLRHETAYLYAVVAGAVLADGATETLLHKALAERTGEAGENAPGFRHSETKRRNLCPDREKLLEEAANAYN